MREPKFEFRAPKAGEWYLDVDDMAVPIYTDETLGIKQWVIVKPGPEPVPWPGPEQEVIVITGISNSERPHRFLALRNSFGDYRDEDGHMWYKDDREYDASYITSWEPYQPGVRTVSSPEDLRTLPRDSVVRDVDGDAWQKRHHDKWSCASPAAVSQYTSDDLYIRYSPLTIVYTTKEKS